MTVIGIFTQADVRNHQQVRRSIFDNLYRLLNNTGRASATLAVPNAASLKGVTLHHAFVVIDLGQPNAIGTVSNGLPVTIF